MASQQGLESCGMITCCASKRLASAVLHSKFKIFHSGLSIGGMVTETPKMNLNQLPEHKFNHEHSTPLMRCNFNAK